MTRSFTTRVALLLLPAAAACRTTPPVPPGIPPEQVADYIHTVIAADRETYAEQVVHRLQDVDGVIKANEHFREEKALPLPAQMLRMGAKLASENGPFRYALISPWAINKANLPRSDFEKKGMEVVAGDASKPFTSYETVAGKRYFMALYADRAVSEACIKCHNAHEESPRRDFKLGETMGGISIALPLD